MISGNKDELISRLLGANEAEKSSKNILDSSNSEQEKDDAIDRLLSRIDSDSSTQSIEDEAEDSNEPEEVLEAEVMEARSLRPRPDHQFQKTEFQMVGL